MYLRTLWLMVDLVRYLAKAYSVYMSQKNYASPIVSPPSNLFTLFGFRVSGDSARVHKVFLEGSKCSLGCYGVINIEQFTNFVRVA